jgi:hypothetical protein
MARIPIRRKENLHRNILISRDKRNEKEEIVEKQYPNSEKTKNSKPKYYSKGAALQKTREITYLWLFPISKYELLQNRKP